MVNKLLKNKGFYYWFTTIVFMLSILVVHVGSALSDADIGHSSSPLEVAHICLTISSNPEGADIYFDGKNIGNTPMDYGITDLKIHDICLKLEGYDSWKEKYNPSLDSNKIKVSLNKMKDLTPSITETEEMKSLSIKDENIKPNSPGKTEIASNPPEEGPDFLGVSSLAILLCGYLIMRYKK